MNKYLLDPNVCPSSLNEHDEPVDPDNTDHQWDETQDPMVCSECGAIKEPITKGKALSILSDILDYYLESTDDRQNQIEVIELERYIRTNLK